MNHTHLWVLPRDHAAVRGLLFQPDDVLDHESPGEFTVYNRSAWEDFSERLKAYRIGHVVAVEDDDVLAMLGLAWHPSVADGKDAIVTLGVDSYDLIPLPLVPYDGTCQLPDLEHEDRYLAICKLLRP